MYSNCFSTNPINTWRENKALKKVHNRNINYHPKLFWQNYKSQCFRRWQRKDMHWKSFILIAHSDMLWSIPSRVTEDLENLDVVAYYSLHEFVLYFSSKCVYIFNNITSFLAHVTCYLRHYSQEARNQSKSLTQIQYKIPSIHVLKRFTAYQFTEKSTVASCGL